MNLVFPCEDEMNTITSTLAIIVAVLVAGIFAALWWNERVKERPTTEPAILVSRVEMAEFVPVRDSIYKVYAVCPTGFGAVGQYVMSWVAKPYYSADLSSPKVERLPGERVRITIPEISLLEDAPLISAEDHYWFAWPAELGMGEHYEKEKKRAVALAKREAIARINDDGDLRERVKTQLQLLFATAASTAPEKVQVNIERQRLPLPPALKPPLCEDQPSTGGFLPDWSDEDVPPTS